MNTKNFEIKNKQIFDQYKEKELTEIENAVNNGLKKLGATGKITFFADRNMKETNNFYGAADIKKIKYANQRMVFKVNAKYIFNLSDICRLILIAKKSKFVKAGYSLKWVFNGRDESMMDFFAWICETENVGEKLWDLEGYDFLSNLFQHRKME